MLVNRPLPWLGRPTYLPTYLLRNLEVGSLIGLCTCLLNYLGYVSRPKQLNNLGLPIYLTT
jgi:hypothetical protein